MLRACLTALGFSLILVWVVGVTDHATIWMTWLDGIAGLLMLLLVPVTRPTSGPIAASVGPALIGGGLIAMFIVGLGAHASGWLTWFTFTFGAGALMFAGLAFAVQAIEPQLESRRPIEAL